MRSAGSKAVAALLAVCKELQLDAVERLKALSLFCDRFIPVHQCDFRKSDSESFSMLSSVLPSDRPFLFSAVGCILVHVCSRHRICVSGSDLEFVVERENLIQVYKAASKVIGPGFDVSFSSGDLQRAAEEIRKLVRNLTRERDSADFLQIFFVQLEHVCVAQRQASLLLCSTGQLSKVGSCSWQHVAVHVVLDVLDDVANSGRSDF